MKLKRHLDARKVGVGLYLLAFAVYLIIGLQPAEAVQSTATTELKIPSISLTADVTELQLNNGKLDTPDTIVGSYSRARNKTLLIGHSTTVFGNLKDVKLNHTITYNDTNYRVVSIRMTRKENIKMSELLEPADRDTLVIMTCAGQLLDNNDATHRLLLTAIITK